MEKQARSKQDVFKSDLVKGAYFSSTHEFPLIKRSVNKPGAAIPFDKARKSKNYEDWIHFYIDDERFECVWNNPKQYLALLKRFAGVITTDFSLYRSLPISMQIWNTYRNRAIAYWLQSNDVGIVPNIRWGDERTYSFAFEGIEQGGTVAVSTNGCIRKKIDRYYFVKGLEQMILALKPETIVNYSCTPGDIFDPVKEQGIEVISIENYALTVRKGVRL